MNLRPISVRPSPASCRGHEHEYLRQTDQPPGRQAAITEELHQQNLQNRDQAATDSVGAAEDDAGLGANIGQRHHQLMVGAKPDHDKRAETDH